MADWTPQSRSEEILFKTINGEPYDGLPQSRIEELLLELKDVIESGGGGGGGTDNYNSLKNLPQINGTTLKGNKTSADLGLPSVAANPTGEAVGELTSIDINGSKYSIPESSEYEETTLWTGSGDMMSSFTATIANPYTDYDALRFEYESGNSSHNYKTHYEKLISKDTLSTPEWFSISDFYLPNGAGVNSAGKFTDTTHLSVQLHSVNWFTSCTLTKIVGIKYGNGVSSGGGGGTYTTTVLFTNGASGDTTFQLSSAYTNFDAIAIYYSHFDGQDQYEDVRIYPTTFLNSVSSTDEVLGLTNDVWYYYFSVYSTTEFRYVKSNAGYITDIIGIKYGSNSGGGVGRTTLSNTIMNAATSYTLSDDYTNYDFIEFWTANPDYVNSECLCSVVDASVLEDMMDESRIYTMSGYGSRFINMSISGTTLTIQKLDGMNIIKIVGVSLGSGGGGNVPIENVFAPQIFSLSERQVGVWADGKPLYQKSYVFTFNSTDSIILDSNITQSVASLVSISTSYSRSGDGANVAPFISDQVARIFIDADGVKHEGVGYASWMGTVNGRVTIKYTKTADTEGSGEWTPQGVPAVHYSTDEQVVGTWVDGKTLFQKTIVTNAQVVLSDNSWTAVPFASGAVPSGADTMFCTEQFDTRSDSHLICDNRTRFIYDNGAIKGATSQTGGQTIPAGLALTIRYTKTS